MCFCVICLIIYRSIRSQLPVILDTETFSVVCSFKFDSETEAPQAVLSAEFSERGLIDAVKAAIERFKKSEMLEMCAYLYTWIEPLLQARRYHKELAENHKELCDLYGTISSKVYVLTEHD